MPDNITLSALTMLHVVPFALVCCPHSADDADAADTPGNGADLVCTLAAHDWATQTLTYRLSGKL